MGSNKISVIIPIYNVEKYLRECLNSVVNQTLKDIEIICINDGSTDGSLKILEEYAQKDSRIIIINQENQGQGVARNKGIDIAKGEYIAFADPDDFIDLNAFEIVYNKFKETNADIVQFDFQTCKENGKFSGKQPLSKRAKKYLNFKLKNNQIFNWNEFKKQDFTGLRLCIWDKVYATELIKNNNIKLAESKFGEDNIFSINSSLLAKKILYLNKYFYHYRIRQGSAVHKPSDDNFCVFNNVKLLKDFLIKNNIDEKYENAFRDYLTKAFALHFTNIPEESTERYLKQCADILTPKEYKRFLKETGPKYTFWQKIFSIKNHKVNGVKHKTVCILGIKYKLKHRSVKNEQHL